MLKRKLDGIDCTISSLMDYVSCSVTDIGGMTENQDDCFTIKIRSQNILIVGVLDGHGKEHGKEVTIAAKEAMCDYFSQPSIIPALTADTYVCLVSAFEHANQAVKKCISSKQSSSPTSISGLTQSLPDRPGSHLPMNIEEFLRDPEGNDRRSITSENSYQADGGLVGTVMAIVNGVAVVAGVGDVTALATVNVGMHSCESIIQDCAVRFVGDAANSHTSQLALSSIAPVIKRVVSDGLASYVLSHVHSPDDVHEFQRLLSFSNRQTTAVREPLRLLYDEGNKFPGYTCNLKPVFEEASVGENGSFPSSGSCTAENASQRWFKYAPKGRVYKNVRGEYATLAVGMVQAFGSNGSNVKAKSTLASCDDGSTSSSNSRFEQINDDSMLTRPYCLSCTRSIGDFPLVPLGITHLPTVLSMDLRMALSQTSTGSQASSLLPTRMTNTSSSSSCIDSCSSRYCPRLNILIASDGVWDNWKYEEASKLIWTMQESHLSMQRQQLQQQNSTSSSFDYGAATKYALYCFMKTNKERSIQLFGPSTDNATATLTCVLMTAT